jgi:hypothetical protein
VTRLVCGKITQNVTSPFLSKFYAYEKSGTKMWPTCDFQKTAHRKRSPIGQNTVQGQLVARFNVARFNVAFTIAAPMSPL